MKRKIPAQSQGLTVRRQTDVPSRTPPRAELEILDEKRREAVAAMSPTLRERFFEIRAALLGGASEEARARYEAAQIVLDIKAREKTYGEGAVTLVAAGLGKDVKTVYRWARVAERFDEVAFEALLRLRNRQGEPLVWSHVMELADVPDGDRERWLEQTLTESLSARRLAAAVRQGADRPDGAVLAERVAAVAASLKRDAERWAREADGAGRSTPALLERLDEAIAAHRELRVATDEHLRALSAVRGRITAALAKGGAAPPPRLVWGGDGSQNRRKK